MLIVSIVRLKIDQKVTESNHVLVASVDLLTVNKHIYVCFYPLCVALAFALIYCSLCVHYLFSSRSRFDIRTVT
jgi:hypothetical protein